ncbi:GreA/GreB family elongation factor [Spirosoma sp. KUDC1026]|uniref:GreA/GreB family elongation factor n=1 Tax=Spirosoma sp. KUDC1026 TaxID=2745947 RepID=UPI00159B9889|nr:GreA/GreB family elongation factor [Spirosoma sp. KUDC1026]QKZ12977.1 GreA/GreB family elongation factor [Spirosoma sp. KUDC1026]
MSSAFLKNETADAPVVIPARAPLPPGTPNYVTPRGLDLLRAELTDLETERAHLQAAQVDDLNERSRQLALLNGRIANLNQRISSSKVVNTHEQDSVRFGATISLKILSGKLASTERHLTIVGVDEANAAKDLIAFTAPLARALQGKRVGEVIAWPPAQGQQKMEIVAIRYDIA